MQAQKFNCIVEVIVFSETRVVKTTEAAMGSTNCISDLCVMKHNSPSAEESSASATLAEVHKLAKNTWQRYKHKHQHQRLSGSFIEFQK